MRVEAQPRQLGRSNWSGEGVRREVWQCGVDEGTQCSKLCSRLGSAKRVDNKSYSGRPGRSGAG
jgi:hypothetical protein